MSLAIFMREHATVFRAPLKCTRASCAARASNYNSLFTEISSKFRQFFIVPPRDFLKMKIWKWKNTLFWAVSNGWPVILAISSATLLSNPSLVFSPCTYVSHVTRKFVEISSYVQYRRRYLLELILEHEGELDELSRCLSQSVQRNLSASSNRKYTCSKIANCLLLLIFSNL